MTRDVRPTLEYYLKLAYPFTVTLDDGSYFIDFPDLPGCFTQVEDGNRIAAMADEIRTLWIETAYESGESIPEPASAAEFSGKFLTRVSKSLHRDLVHQAQREGISLNAYVNYLLAGRMNTAQLSNRLNQLESHVAALEIASRL